MDDIFDRFRNYIERMHPTIADLASLPEDEDYTAYTYERKKLEGKKLSTMQESLKMHRITEEQQKTTGIILIPIKIDKRKEQIDRVLSYENTFYVYPSDTTYYENWTKDKKNKAIKGKEDTYGAGHPRAVPFPIIERSILFKDRFSDPEKRVKQDFLEKIKKLNSHLIYIYYPVKDYDEDIIALTEKIEKADNTNMAKATFFLIGFLLSGIITTINREELEEKFGKIDIASKLNGIDFEELTKKLPIFALEQGFEKEEDRESLKKIKEIYNKLKTIAEIMLKNEKGLEYYDEIVNNIGDNSVKRYFENMYIALRNSENEKQNYESYADIYQKIEKLPIIIAETKNFESNVYALQNYFVEVNNLVGTVTDLRYNDIKVLAYKIGKRNGKNKYGAMIIAGFIVAFWTLLLKRQKSATQAVRDLVTITQTVPKVKHLATIEEEDDTFVSDIQV